MKYIKQYESISNDLKKHELILSKLVHSNYDYDLYILLNDVPRSKRALDVFHIAEISFGKTDCWYILEGLEDSRIYKNKDTRSLTEKEQKLLFERLEQYKFQKNGVVQRVLEETDIDITQTDNYKDFFIKKDLEKYNI